MYSYTLSNLEYSYDLLLEIVYFYEFSALKELKGLTIALVLTQIALVLYSLFSFYYYAKNSNASLYYGIIANLSDVRSKKLSGYS